MKCERCEIMEKLISELEAPLRGHPVPFPPIGGIGLNYSS